MIAVSAALVLLAAILLSTAYARGPLVGPERLFPIFVAITNVPFLIFFQFDPLVAHPRVISAIGDQASEVAVLLAILLIVFMVAHRIGASAKFANLPLISYPDAIGLRTSILLIVGAIVISIIVFIQLEGFAYWQANVMRRTFVFKQNILATTATAVGFWLGCLVLLQHASASRRVGLWIAFVAMTLLAIFFLSFTGARKSSIYLVSFCLLYFVMKGGRVRLVWAIPIMAVVLAYFLVVGSLRSTGAGSFSVQGALGSTYNSIRTAVGGMSYAGQYLVIVHHFNWNHLWAGQQYLVLPDRLFGRQNVIDDGVAVRAIAFGYDVNPRDIPYFVYLSSWPPETFGSAFANFWIPGVVVFGYVLGLVHKVAYTYARLAKYSPMGVLIYGFTFANFQLSNLRLVQFAAFVICTIVIVLMTRSRSNGLRNAREA